MTKSKEAVLLGHGRTKKRAILWGWVLSLVGDHLTNEGGGETHIKKKLLTSTPRSMYGLAGVAQ